MELRRYFRDSKGQAFGIIVSNGPNSVGWAFVRPGYDKFNKERGLEIARGREAKGTKSIPPLYAQAEVNYMLQRSKTAKYE